MNNKKTKNKKQKKTAYSKYGLLPLQSHFFVTGLVFSLSKGSPLSSDSIKRNSEDCK
jgi:hypothetical protein